MLESLRPCAADVSLSDSIPTDLHSTCERGRTVDEGGSSLGPRVIVPLLVSTV